MEVSHKPYVNLYLCFILFILDISGVPGIGKTASVMEIKNKLQKTKNFEFIYVNGMNFSVPEGIYSYILKEITGIENVSRNSACSILSKILIYFKFFFFLR